MQVFISTGKLTLAWVPLVEADLVPIHVTMERWHTRPGDIATFVLWEMALASQLRKLPCGLGPSNILG